MDKLSQHYGEFRRGTWIPFPQGMRKHEGKTLLKVQGKFTDCPFCGHPVGGTRRTSEINTCRSCGTPMIVTKFAEIKKAEKEVNQ